MMSCFYLLIVGLPGHLCLFIRLVVAVVTEMREYSYQKFSNFYVLSRHLLIRVSSSLSLIKQFYLVNFLKMRIWNRCSKFFIGLTMIELFQYPKEVIYGICF